MDNYKNDEVSNIPYQQQGKKRRFVQLSVQERASVGINEIEVEDEPKFFGINEDINRE